jgi:signal transduction histidine kinase/CheY-like chemotaxis protein
VALLQSKKTYVRYISHELRTPLNTAFLGLKLLTNEFKASNEMRDVEHYETLCDVNMSCTAAVSILNDLLCYEKLESGRMELHKENVGIEDFLNNSLSLFSSQALECGVSITLDLEKPLTLQEQITNGSHQKTLPLQPLDSVYVDRFKMDQVVRNLLSNALKFTPRGGFVTVKAFFTHDYIEDPDQTGEMTSGEVESGGSSAKVCQTGADPRPLSYSGSIKYRLAESCRIATNYRHKRDLRSRSVSPKPILLAGDPILGKLIIVVTDTGAGISEDNQKRLFKEIIQFSPEKLQSGGGSGLGLWITAGILDLHDGGIRVHSSGEGTGTSFTVEIPMTRHPADSVTITPHEATNPTDEIPDSILEISALSDRNTFEDIGAFEGYIPTQDPVQSATPIHIGTRGGSGTLSRLQTFNLLVVDDSRLNRKMLLKCLKADGHTCWEAEDGLQAIAMVKDRVHPEDRDLCVPFDAILMDFVMPNMDGPEATKEIRSLGYKGLIFGVTGNGENFVLYDMCNVM